MAARLIIAMVFATVWAALLAAPAQAATHGRVVLIGVPSLRWSDISAQNTPALWQLAQRSSLASMSVRTMGTTTCPEDGWVSVSASNHAAAVPHNCDLPPEPLPAGRGATVPGFAAWSKAGMDSSFTSHIGLIGDAVHAAGGCTTAVGAGAALALADSAGHVDNYLPAGGRPDWSQCPVAAVDVDDIVRAYINAGITRDQRELPRYDGLRRTALKIADQRIGAVLASLPHDTTVIVAGVTDLTIRPHLRVVMAAGPDPRGGSYGTTFLGSNSTRRNALVTLPDVTSATLAAAGVTLPREGIGHLWSQGDHWSGVAGAVASLSDADRAAQAIRDLMTPFYTVVVTVQLLLYATATFALRRRSGTPRVLAVTRVVAIIAAALPISSIVANLIPWWHASAPVPVLLMIIAVIDAAITAVALGGPWRRSVLMPGTIVAAITAAAITIDVFTGATLQMNSPTGYSPLVAGRFYGVGNIVFPVYCSSVLLTAVGLAHLLIRRNRRREAVAVVLALGLSATLIDMLPYLGADFDTGFVLGTGTAITALIVARQRVTVWRVLGIGALGVCAVVANMFLDYSRPTDKQTHIGRFGDQVVHGQAWPVITRKFDEMLNSVGNPTLTPIVLAALLFVAFALYRPGRYEVGGLQLAYDRAPELRAGLVGVLVTAFLGFATNDSGVVIPALALVLTAPIALAASVRALQLRSPSNGAPLPTPVEAR
ncbi:MAG TPA: hypothetical protein VNW94_00575 [Streptosporangiaceae bacterium]|nr:hypothetical protein [Streptosporangiaceae bacterium]